MARTNVPITTLAGNTANANPATTALDATNGHVIAASSVTDRLVIEIINTFAGSKSATVKAGVNPPSFRASLGDLVKALAQNEVTTIVLESARFTQADGSIWIDLTAATTGTIRAIRMPAV